MRYIVIIKFYVINEKQRMSNIVSFYSPITIVIKILTVFK